MARPPKKLDEKQIAECETLGALLSLEQIADYFGIARNTFTAICDRQPEVLEQYKKGKSKAIGAVAKGLLQQAREGNMTAAIFYLKTQAGWRETTVQELTGKDGKPLQSPVIVISADEADQDTA